MAKPNRRFGLPMSKESVKDRARRIAADKRRALLKQAKKNVENEKPHLDKNGNEFFDLVGREVRRLQRLQKD